MSVIEKDGKLWELVKVDSTTVRRVLVPADSAIMAAPQEVADGQVRLGSSGSSVPVAAGADALGSAAAPLAADAPSARATDAAAGAADQPRAAAVLAKRGDGPDAVAPRKPGRPRKAG